MRFILILLIAMALTITWQTSVMADLTQEQAVICSGPFADGDAGTETEEDEEEPDCD